MIFKTHQSFGQPPLKREASKPDSPFQGGIKRGLVLLFIIFCSLFLPSPAVAQHFQSNSFIIDWGNFNMTSGTKVSNTYHLSDTVGQNAPGQYDSDHYTLKAGAQYAYDRNYPFSFSISSLQIKFGSLVIGVASTATNILTVTSPAGHGYQVNASYNHPLSLLNSGTTIPDVADGVWTTNYGFGFNASGVGTSAYFPSSSYYRHFSVIPQTIMSENTRQENRQATITYKINISSLQPAGDYENAIIYTAVPIY
jgi:hypothetical protein